MVCDCEKYLFQLMACKYCHKIFMADSPNYCPYCKSHNLIFIKYNREKINEINCEGELYV